MSWRGVLAWSAVGIALVVVVFWLETFAADAGRAPGLELPDVHPTVWLAIGGYLLVAFALAAYLVKRRRRRGGLPRRPALKWIAAALALTLLGGQVVLVFAKDWAALFLAPAAVLPTLAVMAYILRRIGGRMNWRLLSVAFVGGTFVAPLVASVMTPLVMLSLYLAQGAPQVALFATFAPMIALYSVAAPIAEEAAKQAGVVMLRHRIRRASDAFMVGMATGAGFAIMEDLLYISVDLRPADWPVTVAIRAMSHLVHPLLAGLIALQLYGAMKSRTAARDRLVRSYATAVMLHGLWNLPWALVYQIRPLWDPLGGLLEREQADLGANLLLALISAVLYLPLVLAMWRTLTVTLEQVKAPRYDSPEAERAALFAGSWRRPIARLTAFVARQTRLAVLADRVVRVRPATEAGELAGLGMGAGVETPALPPTGDVMLPGFLAIAPPVKPDLPPAIARFRRRLAAAVLDLVAVLALPAGLFVYMASSPGNYVPPWFFLASPLLSLASFVALSLFLRRSPGKAALRLRLANNDERRTGRGRLLARELLAKPLSLGWVGLGFWWAAWDEEGQGWHDLLVGTRVVRPDGDGEELGG
ncbi:MAG: PrsW family glutamic-type intramembrane protease [Chloroflexota bacterium]|jgi:RsiW-degrading membrane proteinase PrsW (M82 family)/uncharacterized RDD family membrane protein YckC|nr:PrsW family glutamic-type intramembrane protease [Chloroflexota bacterium]MDP6758586.1 PrsW family glutamic-type intramembrane protease [Chloroflexota bacterium]